MSFPSRVSRYVRGHKQALALLFLGLVVPLTLLILLANAVLDDNSVPFDRTVAQTVRGTRLPALDLIARAVDVIAGVWGMLAIGLWLSASLYRVRRRLGWFVAGTLAGAALAGLISRMVTDRPRPTGDALLSAPGDSFFSGHVAVAAAMIFVLSVVLWSTRKRLPTLLFGVPFVVLVMWSRVYGGVHHASDVVAGMLFGVAWSTAVMLATRAHRTR